MQNIHNQYLISQTCAPWGGWHHASGCRADTRKSCTGLSSRQEPDSGMHGLEPGSGSQERQGSGSSSEVDQEYDMHGMEYLVGQHQVTCSICPSLQV